jgi:mediator of RNA polymerase II transcription subunit 31
MASEAPQDVSMTSTPAVPAADEEPKYGGYSRFEIELEVKLSPSPRVL